MLCMKHLKSAKKEIVYWVMGGVDTEKSNVEILVPSCCMVTCSYVRSVRQSFM